MRLVPDKRHWIIDLLLNMKQIKQLSFQISNIYFSCTDDTSLFLKNSQNTFFFPLEIASIDFNSDADMRIYKHTYIHSFLTC